MRWEYACLEGPHRREGPFATARLWLSSSGSEAVLAPRPFELTTRSPWAVIGLMGEEGWELVAVNGRRFYFKRPIPPSEA